MAKDRQTGRLAVILHADVADSTQLVQQDEYLAHERIQDAFNRFGDTISQYSGRVLELRGDALLAEFEKPSDAVAATLAFQSSHSGIIKSLKDDLKPEIRVGIAMGEVVIADTTVTGAGVVLAQRVEQLAVLGGLCITAAIHEALSKRLSFDLEDIGEQSLKGFDYPVRVYRVSLRGGETIPRPDQNIRPVNSVRSRRILSTVAVMTIVITVGATYWFKPWQTREEAASLDRMAFPLPDKPSVAVLPFDNLGDDPDQEIFADAITRDIISDLSRFGDLIVIAANSTFVYKRRPVKVQHVAEDLGVRYVVEGSIQKSENKIRVNTQFIDAITGEHLWAERYERDMQDVFAVQDEITQKIVSTLGKWSGRISEVTLAQAMRKSTTNLTAYENFLLGVELGIRFTKVENAQARELFEKAIEHDPGYARAYATLAWTHVFDWLHGWSESEETSAALAYQFAKKAVEIDDSEAEAHWVLAKVYGQIRKQPEEAIAEFERALALNPNHPDILAAWGGYDMPVLTGRADEGVELVKKAMRINPSYLNWYEEALGLAAYVAHRYDEASSAFKKVKHHTLLSRATFAASYAQLGQLAEARAETEKLLMSHPEITVERFVGKLYFKNPADLEHYKEGLRKAGVPEHLRPQLPGG